MTGVNQPWSGRKLHFVGIGGVGMSGLAKVARILGAEVTGSDRAQGGHDASNVPADATVVYSTAIPPDNPERTTGAPELLAPANAPRELTIDATHVYFAVTPDGLVMSVPKAGGAAKVLACSDERALTLELNPKLCARIANRHADARTLQGHIEPNHRACVRCHSSLTVDALPSLSITIRCGNAPSSNGS